MVTWKADFAIALLRSHRIHETLMLVLLSWIPKDIFKTWTKNPTVLKMINVCIYAFFHIFHLFILETEGKIDW
jgi:hypothetical protein